MSKELATPEAHSELEAARAHHKRELQAQAEKVSRLLAYRKMRMDQFEGDHSLPRNAHEKGVYRECAEALGVPVPEVRRLIDSVETLAEKLPETYTLYRRGETDLTSVQKVNRAIEGICHRPELMEKLDGELKAKAGELNSAELDNWLKQRVPQLDTKAFEERYERAKHKHYVAFNHQGDGTTKVHGLISTTSAARIEQMLYSMARNMPRKASTTDAGEQGEERTHTQRMADIFTTALTTGLQGAPAPSITEGARSEEGSQLPLPVEAAANTSLPANPIPGPAGAGAARIGVLIPVKTLTGESDDPAISWDRTWMLPASEARTIAGDTSAKHDWYTVGTTQDTSEDEAAGQASTAVGEVLTVTKPRTAPASTSTEDIDQWVSKTDPQTQNLLTKTYESRTARAHQRNAVLIRDGQCQTPGCTESGWSAEIDHKQSIETGGATTGENLQTLCKACHDIKSHKHHPPDEVASDWDIGPPPDWAVDHAA